MLSCLLIVVVHPSICEDAPTFLESKHDFTHLWSGSGKRLNTKQMEAMKKALQYKFTLIQGPPGIAACIFGWYMYHPFCEYTVQFNQRALPCCLIKLNCTYSFHFLHTNKCYHLYTALYSCLYICCNTIDM